MPPSIVLVLVLSVFIGSLTHVLAGRKPWQWPLFLATALVGCSVGFFVGVAWDLDWMRVGDVPLLTVLLGAAVVTGLGWLFSTPPAAHRPSDAND